MPLTCPMHAIPGELLTCTELQEDVDYNPKWKVPNSLFDISDHRIMIEYRDLWLVLASWGEQPDTDSTFDQEVFRTWPALMLHLRSGKIFRFDDTESLGWLWRPGFPDKSDLRQVAELIKRW